MKRALQVILAIALIGVAFSATLTMLEYRSAGELATGCTPVGSPDTLLGYAPCVYGLLMYAAVSVFALLGLRASRAPPEA